MALNRTQVILESPYAGKSKEELNRNTRYAVNCLRDSIRRGEAPMASHVLYANSGVLDDDNAKERQQGIEAGLAWGRHAKRWVVYTDLGVTEGMRLGIGFARAMGIPIEERSLKEGKLEEALGRDSK